MKYSDWQFFQNARSNEYEKHDLLNIISDMAQRLAFLEDARVQLWARMHAAEDNIRQLKKGKV